MLLVKFGCIEKSVKNQMIFLRTFATIRKNEKCFQRLEFNVTVYVGYLSWIVFKFDVDPKSTG